MQRKETSRKVEPECSNGERHAGKVKQKNLKTYSKECPTNREREENQNLGLGTMPIR